MIHGASRSFIQGSRMFLVNLKSPEYDGQPVYIRSWLETKQRWNVQLVRQEFHSKCVSVAEDKLMFDYYVADRKDATPLPVGLQIAMTGFGESLMTNRSIAKGERVLVDNPLMVTANRSARQTRWNAYYATVLLHGKQSSVLQQLENLADGGFSRRLRNDATLLWKDMVSKYLSDAAIQEMKSSRQHLVEEQITNIANVLAKWQANCHAFPMRDGTVASAIFPLVAKMDHSCCANCAHNVTTDGTMVVEAIRDISIGERLTCCYMGFDKEFTAMGVDGRRAVLKPHGFTCMCSRCLSESEEEKHVVVASTSMI